MKINKDNIKIKNLIGIIDNPTYEDLLFEIISFLEDENKEEFNKWDVTVKTRCRINSSLDQDLQALVDKGYIEHQKYTLYKVVKHPWNENTI
jgi:hypothetical protein